MGRALVATGLLSAWLVLLLSGVALGGAVHLLLLAALVTYPWRVALAADDEPEEPTP